MPTFHAETVEGRAMKILVVDDHALVREGLRQVLAGLQEAPEVLDAPDCTRAFD
ncbi:MAG: response regulator transcription factor [Rhodoferax sp.]|nr:response regulator transcription factor [Rhodoferax sp.]